MKRCDRLGGDLCKDQNHKREDQRCDGNTSIPEQPDRNNRCDRRCQNIDQIVANQDQTNQSVGPLQEFYSASRSAVPRTFKVFQTIAVE